MDSNAKVLRRGIVHALIEGSELYKRMIEREWESKESADLMRQVWSSTPWMIEAYTGSINHRGRFREIMCWCQEQFGDEAWPIHGKPGLWHSGGATVCGWTWMGFSTREAMHAFTARWPNPESDTVHMYPISSEKS